MFFQKGNHSVTIIDLHIHKMKTTPNPALKTTNNHNKTTALERSAILKLLGDGGGVHMF